MGYRERYAGPDGPAYTLVLKTDLTKNLALGELEPLTRALLAVFLSFFGARIASDKPSFFQARAKLAIYLDQRASYAVAHSSCLSSYTAALDVNENVELADGIDQMQRLADYHPMRLIRKVLFELSFINDYLTVAGPKKDPSRRALASARTVTLRRIWHCPLLTKCPLRNVPHPEMSSPTLCELVPIRAGVSSEPAALELDQPRLLGRVRMICSNVYPKLLCHCPTELRFGKHSYNG